MYEKRPLDSPGPTGWAYGPGPLASTGLYGPASTYGPRRISGSAEG